MSAKSQLKDTWIDDAVTVTNSDGTARLSKSTISKKKQLEFLK